MVKTIVGLNEVLVQILLLILSITRFLINLLT
jgi:hypothetical protein